MIFTIVFIVLLWYIEKNTEVCRPDSLRWYGSGRKGIAMLKDGKIVLAKTEDRELFLLPQMTNRHGLIAGATGTGKTVTMKVTTASDASYADGSNPTGTYAIQSGTTNDETVVVSGTSTNKEVTFDLSNSSIKTGYIVSTNGAVRIWEISVEY